MGYYIAYRVLKCKVENRFASSLISDITLIILTADYLIVCVVP